MENNEMSVEGQVAHGTEGVIEATAESHTDKDRNFAALRESKEREVNLRQQAERRVMELEYELRHANAPQKKEDESNFNFSDAIDSEHLSKMKSYIEDTDRKWAEKFARLEASYRKQSLRSTDAHYDEIVNKYLPGVIASDPEVKTIISNTDPNLQLDLMYRLAKTNPDYMREQYVDKAKSEGRVSEPKEKINSLGAVSSGRTGGGGHMSAMNMSSDDFYGSDGYLQKVLDGRIS